MSGFADYEHYDALGLADLVRRKDVTPSDLLEAAIERVEARNAAVNAVVMPLYDYGRKAIADGLPDGPFRGVPFLLKDLGGWLAGIKAQSTLWLMSIPERPTRGRTKSFSTASTHFGPWQRTPIAAQQTPDGCAQELISWSGRFRRLGLTVPPLLLAGADEVIE
jgi:hypothetical protein